MSKPNWSRSSLQWLMDFLHYYEVVSGQLISQVKSSFCIASLVSASRQAIVRSVIGFQRHLLSFTYLECPVFTGCLQISHFDDTIWKVRDRIFGWANRLLSFGEKLVVIHHVLSSMPLHLFHVLRPLVAVVQRLVCLFTRFLWGDSEERCWIHWCGWSKVCSPDEEVGLGIRSFDDMAVAFELKLWSHFQEQSSLWASFMKSKNCRSTHLGLIQFCYPTSPIWRHLCKI